MNSVEDTKEKIIDSVVNGNLQQLKFLASSFPETFENFRYNNNNNLVDLASENHHNDVCIYLIVDHGFEVSPEFEKKNKIFTGEYMANGVNEYHQTLELLANAALGKDYSNEQPSLACYTIKYWALGGGHDTPELKRADLNPEFLRLAASRRLATFAKKRCVDERHSMIPTAHSSRMVKAINNNINSIETTSREALSIPPTTTGRSI